MDVGLVTKIVLGFLLYILGDIVYMAKCSWCKGEMPDERLEFYTVCADCNNEKAYLGLQNFGHKTASVAVLIKPTGTPQNNEVIRQAINAHKRKR